MILLTKLLKSLTALALATLLAACGTDSSSSGDASSSSDSGPGFSLRLTDAAFDDAVSIKLTFARVRLRKVDGGWIDIPVMPSQTVDLMQLQGTKTDELDLATKLPPVGDYNELRLVLSGASMKNTIELSAGGTLELMIPSGSSSGLKVKGDFSIFEDRPTSLIADIDLRQSVKMAGPNYIMTPVIRLVEGGNFGHVRGLLDSALLTDPSCSDAQADTFNAAYVYSGHNVIPDDIDQQSNSDIDPIATTKISYDAGSSGYIYEAAFLPAGDYTIAFTCNSDLDDLDADDDLKFFDIQNVTVKVNNTLFL